MDISIIIPVYNVEKYLVRCLDSIFKQQFSGTFEVIAVDDASTDHSLNVLCNYQKNENRLHIIPLKINSKQPIARSTGMDASKGEYIMHVDADDWILPGTLEKLYSRCKETKADVVAFNYIREHKDGEQIMVRQISKDLITNDKLKVQRHFLGASVTKIVKRNLTVDMISSRVGLNTGEDLLYATEILLRANKICLTAQSFYMYYVNTESITHTVRPNQYFNNQIITIQQLQLIISDYHVDSKLTQNILNYFEKWIYLESAKSHFLNRSKKNDFVKLVEEFIHYPIMSRTRIKRLKLSIHNHIICLFEIAFRFGLRTALGIVFRSLRK